MHQAIDGNQLLVSCAKTQDATAFTCKEFLFTMKHLSAIHINIGQKTFPACYVLQYDYYNPDYITKVEACACPPPLKLSQKGEIYGLIYEKLCLSDWKKEFIRLSIDVSVSQEQPWSVSGGKGPIVLLSGSADCGRRIRSVCHSVKGGPLTMARGLSFQASCVIEGKWPSGGVILARRGSRGSDIQ